MRTTASRSNIISVKRHAIRDDSMYGCAKAFVVHLANKPTARDGQGVVSDSQRGGETMATNKLVRGGIAAALILASGALLTPNHAQARTHTASCVGWLQWHTSNGNGEANLYWNSCFGGGFAEGRSGVNGIIELKRDGQVISTTNIPACGFPGCTPTTSYYAPGGTSGNAIHFDCGHSYSARVETDSSYTIETQPVAVC